jgi:hypothetical protein
MQHCVVHAMLGLIGCGAEQNHCVSCAGTGTPSEQIVTTATFGETSASAPGLAHRT